MAKFPLPHQLKGYEALLLMIWLFASYGVLREDRNRTATVSQTRHDIQEWFGRLPQSPELADMSLMAKLIIGVALASQHQRNLLLREEESVTDLLADISTHERHCSDRGGCEVGSSSSPQHIPENDEQLNSGDDSGRGEVSDLLGNLPTTDLIDRTRVDIVGEGRAEEATDFPTNLNVVTNRDDSGGGGRVEGEERLDIERGEYHPLPNPRQVSRTRKRIDKDLSYRPPTKRQKLPVPMSRLGLELPSISRSTLNPATTLARPEDQNQPERHCSDRGGFEVGISSSPPYIPESDEQSNSEEVLLFSDENNAPCTGSDGPESGDDSGRGEVSDLLGNLPTTDLIDRTRVDIVGEGREEEATGVPGNLPHAVENFPETVTDRTRDGREEEDTNFPVPENLIQPVPAQPVPAQPLQPNPRRVPRWKIIDNKWPKYVYSENPNDPKYPMKWWIPKTRQRLPKSQRWPKSYNDFEFMFREFFPSGLNLAAKFPLDQPEDQNQPERHCSDRGGFEVGSSSRSHVPENDDSLGDGREEEDTYLPGNVRHPTENLPTVVTNRDDSGGGSPSPNNDEEAEESQWASFKKLSMELSLDRKESFWLFTQYLVLSQLEDGAKKEGYTTLLQMRQDPPEEGEAYGDIRIKARPRGPNDRIQHPDELGL